MIMKSTHSDSLIISQEKGLSHCQFIHHLTLQPTTSQTGSLEQLSVNLINLVLSLPLTDFHTIYESLFVCGKLRSLYQGTDTAATRAALPSPTRVCDVLLFTYRDAMGHIQ